MKLDQAIQHLQQAGYSERPGQLDMMQVVEKAMRLTRITVIEGGTGVGKSFGYLIPALLNLPKDKKLVIATATVSLQEQLLNKDLPAVKKLLNLPVTGQIAKGRRRYVCQQRLYRLQDNDSSQSELDFFGIASGPPSKTDQATINKLVDLLERQQWQGDRDRLTFAVQDSLWRKVTTDSAGCGNRKCPHFSECAYFQSKKLLSQAQVLVTNHDLLLSDIAMGTGVLLPKAEDCIYIIDEAHHLPEKAVQHFASQCTAGGQQEWCDRLVKSLQQLHSKIKLPESILDKTIKAVDELVPLSKEVLAFCRDHFPKDQSEHWLLNRLPEALTEPTKALMQNADIVRQQIRMARKQLTEAHDSKTLPDYDAFVAALGFFLNKADTVWRTWQLFAHVEDPAQPPVAKWITPYVPFGKKSGASDFMCHAAMTSGANMLPAFFWDKIENSVILCSATLRALGKFDDFLQRTGLNFYQNVSTHAYASPFPYEHSPMVIPAMKCEPSGPNAQAHVQEVSTLMPKLLQQETTGTLVLFTSRHMMDSVFDALPSDLQKTVLLQNNYPKQKIISEHKKRIDGQQTSVIFGLQSFAEGIDLPGDYCRHLIITKIPFGVPTTPIEQARSHWLSSQGKNAFQTYSLPQASIRLTQFAGRLIRHEQDRGQLTILDKRLRTKFYGKALLENLPAFAQPSGEQR